MKKKLNKKLKEYLIVGKKLFLDKEFKSKLFEIKIM